VSSICAVGGGGEEGRDGNGMIVGKEEEEEEEEEEEIIWNLQRVRRFLTRWGQLLGRVCEKGGNSGRFCSPLYS
jgi:hypothetical protein